MMNNRSMIDIIKKYAPWVCLLSGYTMTVLTFAFSGGSFLIGDDCSEWVLASHLNKTGRFISRDWFYGTELHVFFSQILNRFLIHWFSDWHVARTISVAVFIALFVIVFLLICKELDLGNSGVWMAAVMTFPFSSEYGYFILLSGFYSFYYLITLIIVYLHLLLLRRSYRLFWPVAAACCILAFLSGLNGVRFLIILYFPLVLTAVIELERIIHRNDNIGSLKQLLSSKEAVRLLFVLTESMFCAAGWIINEKYLSRVYSYLTYKNNNLHTFRLSEFLDYLSKYVYLFGYEGIQDFTSYFGIGQLFGLILNLLLIMLLIYGIRSLINDESRAGMLFMFTLAAMISNAFVFYLGQQAESRFLLFAACYFLFAVAIILRHMENNGEKLRRFLAISVMIVCVFAESVGYAYGTGLFFERGAETEEENIASWLVSHGHTHGMSSFYPGALLEYLTSGKLEMWVLYDGPEEGKYIAMPWEQLESHFKAPEDNRAALIVNKEGNSFPEYTSDKEPIYETEHYLIYDIPVVTDFFLEQPLS